MRPVRSLSCSLALAVVPTATAVAQATFVVDTTLDTPDAAPGDGVCRDAAGRCSLRAAIQEANASGGTTVIVLEPRARYPITIAGAGEDAAASGDLDVTAPNVLIEGRGATLDCRTLDRAFDVFPGARLGVSQLTVLNGLVRAESGGGFRTTGSLLLFRSDVVDCEAVGPGASGGGVLNQGGLLAVDQSNIESCEADRAGGAIEANRGTTWVNRSEFYDNETGPMPGNGGGLHLTGAGFVQVQSSTFAGNSAAREGGALWNSSTGFMIVELCDIDDNLALGTAADDGGGGLFNDGGALVVSRTDITRNRAPFGLGSGGGVFNNDGELLLFLSWVEGNRAARAGGGIEAVVGDTIVWGSTLARNRVDASPGNGGALHLTGAGVVRVERSDVRANVAAAEGGGLWNSATGTMVVDRCNVEFNTASGAAADQGGGGLFNDGGTMTVDRSTIDRNVADGALGSGGGILNVGGTVDILRSEVVGNDSQRAGGGVEARAGMTTLDRVDLSWNSTAAAPGNGGGLHITGAGQCFLNDCTVEQNAASSEGGGLWNSASGVLIVLGSVIGGNVAPIRPDLFNDGGLFLVDGVAVSSGP